MAEFLTMQEAEDKFGKIGYRRNINYTSFSSYK